MDPEKVQFSAHALDRCTERFRSRYKSREAMETYLRLRLSCARNIGPSKYYFGGMVFVVRNNVVMTVMRPEERRTQKRITQLFLNPT